MHESYQDTKIVTLDGCGFEKQEQRSCWGHKTLASRTLPPAKLEKT